MRINRLHGTVADRQVNIPVTESGYGNPSSPSPMPRPPTLLDRILYGRGGSGQDIQLPDVPVYDKGQVA